MEREFTRANLQALYQMLFELAKGNLAFKIERSNHHDELEGLIALLNMTAEKLHKNRNQFLWFNRQNEIMVIKTLSFLLNQEYEVVHYWCEIEGFEKSTRFQKILGKPFENLLTKEGRAAWKEKIPGLLNQEPTFTILPLNYKSYNHLNLNLHSVMVRISHPDVINYIITSCLLDIKKDDVFNLPENDSLKKLSIWDQQLFQDLHEYINLHLQEPLKPIYELASLFNTNEHKIKTGFKEIFGVTPFQYHRVKRIEHSKILIAYTDLSLKDIALKMGFRSYPQFSKHFKNYTEMSPRDFKKRIQKS